MVDEPTADRPTGQSRSLEQEKMAVSFGYEDVARLLSMLDTVHGENLEATLGGLRLRVTCWPKVIDAEKVPACQIGPDSMGAGRVASSGEPADTGVDHNRPHMLAKASTVGVFHFEDDSFTAFKPGRKVRENERIGEIVEFGGQAAAVLSPLDGKLVDLCVEDGDFVAYGQTVAVVRHLEVENDTDAGG